MIIKQEKSDKELTENYADKIIDLLRGLNIAEKYKVINSLRSSLLDIIKQEGIIIELLKIKK
jgi:hypothetical protein